MFPPVTMSRISPTRLDTVLAMGYGRPAPSNRYHTAGQLAAALRIALGISRAKARQKSRVGGWSRCPRC